MRELMMAVVPVAVLATFAAVFLFHSGSSAAAAQSFALSSPAFAAKGKIPAKYGCGPERNWRKPSVPLKWSDPPQGTKSFVLLMDDPHPVAKYWVHWLVTDIPVSATGLAENADATGLPRGAKQLKNSYGDTAYGGPCPPKGTHTYRFRLYAMPTATTALDPTGKRGDVLGDELAKMALGVATFSADFP